MRELENLCWRLAALAPGDSIGVADLDEALGLATNDAAGADGGAWERALALWARQQLQAGAGELHAQARARFDRVLLQAALEASDGHRGEAARRLGLGRNAVGRKLGPGRKRR